MVESNPMENWMSLDEVARFVGVSHEAVRRKCLRGRLAYVRKGGRRLVLRENAEAYRAERMARRGQR